MATDFTHAEDYEDGDLLLQGWSKRSAGDADAYQVGSYDLGDGPVKLIRQLTDQGIGGGVYAVTKDAFPSIAGITQAVAEVASGDDEGSYRPRGIGFCDSIEKDGFSFVVAADTFSLRVRETQEILDSVEFLTDVNEFSNIRIEYDPATKMLRGKAWVGEEPENWMIEFEDELEPFVLDMVEFTSSSRDVAYYLKYLGIGTNGDEAPMSDESGGGGSGSNTGRLGRFFPNLFGGS